MSQSAFDRARAGDEEAFRQLTDPHLRELHLHCYRMLGYEARAAGRQWRQGR
jgi:DNA-directed RNA polymerase specialized sigma24 family protein